jgi:hypothetical protein
MINFIKSIYIGNIDYHGSSLENRLFSQDIIDFQQNSTNTAGTSKNAKIKAHGKYFFLLKTSK